MDKTTLVDALVTRVNRTNDKLLDGLITKEERDDVVIVDVADFLTELEKLA